MSDVKCLFGEGVCVLFHLDYSFTVTAEFGIIYNFFILVIYLADIIAQDENKEVDESTNTDTQGKSLRFSFHISLSIKQCCPVNNLLLAIKLLPHSYYLKSLTNIKYTVFHFNQSQKTVKLE